MTKKKNSSKGAMEDLKKVTQNYELELEKLVRTIMKRKAKLVLLQFPDGLKKYALSIADFLEEKTEAQFLIWLGSCFGACDTPILTKDIEKEVDLIVQFGHNELLPSYGLENSGKGLNSN